MGLIRLAGGLAGRVFKFSVSSKAVGFFITNLRSYACKHFECFFHLWGFGGPNWIREEKLFYAELDVEWTNVNRQKYKSGRPLTRDIPVKQAFRSINKNLQPPPNVITPMVDQRSSVPFEHNIRDHSRSSNLRKPPVPSNRPSSGNPGISKSAGRWIPINQLAGPSTASLKPSDKALTRPSDSAQLLLNSCSAIKHVVYCTNCLADGHLLASCINKIRCRNCYGY